MRVDFTAPRESQLAMLYNGSARPLHIDRTTVAVMAEGIECLRLVQDDGRTWELRSSNGLGARLRNLIPPQERISESQDALKRSVLAAAEKFSIDARRNARHG